MPNSVNMINPCRTHLIKGKLLSVLDELSPYELHVILTTFRRCDVRILDNMWQVTIEIEKPSNSGI